MKILDAFFINQKKLKHQTGKALFLIIPIIAIVVLSIVVSSQISNIREATNDVVFGTIEEQSRLIELSVDMSIDPSNPGAFFDAQDQEFSEADVVTISDIDGVESASINTPIPIENIKSTDTFDGVTHSIPELVGMDSSVASLYTSEDFTYTEGEAIPIILNASSFTESYEDWGGETTYTIDFEEVRSQRPEPGSQQGPMEMSSDSPYKTRAIDYDKNELIGKEITIQFGGLDELTNSTRERTASGMTMTLLTDEELQANEDARRAVLESYWDYDKLNIPITYTFEIVGVIEGSSSRSAYVPSDFANEVVSAWIENQLDARTTADISADDLNSTFTGLTYDGIELGTQGGFGFRGGMVGPIGMRPPGQEGSESESTSYRIPGLVIELADDDSGDVVGIYTDAQVYEDSVKTGQTIIIKTASFEDRASVIEALNDNGYAYQDVSNLDTVNELEKTLEKVQTGLVIGFIVLTMAIIIITMGKFVSDSTKEIGIFRAMGMKKRGIFFLFILQSILYTLVGYGIGVGLGIAANIGLSGVVNGWFDNVVVASIKETYNVASGVDTSVFTHVDWGAVGLFTGLLFAVVFIISLIPAIKASSVSPVEAIKGE